MKDWKLILRENFTQIDKLALFLNLDKGQRSQLLGKSKFILNLPVRLANKIVKGTLNDPILKQFVPLNDELKITPGFTADPVEDKTFKIDSKLLQKYPQRSLILSTSACAMHCRYCFRQNFPYETTYKGFEQELESIMGNKDLREIILSGGDPLSLSNENLDDLITKLNQIDHIERIRFHTRFPIGIPERINDEFLTLLEKSQKQIWFVIHCNHPLELDSDVLMALKRVQKLGIPVLNQAVLLKDVNDEVETLKELAEKLSKNGILFYYLHQLDKVQGAAHFETSQGKGLDLIRQLRETLSGYAVPKYVSEVPGHLSKTPIVSI